MYTVKNDQDDHLTIFSILFISSYKSIMIVSKDVNYYQLVPQIKSLAPLSVHCVAVSPRCPEENTEDVLPMLLLSMDDLGHHAAVQDELHEVLDRSRLDKLDDLLTWEVSSHKFVPILED